MRKQRSEDAKVPQDSDDRIWIVQCNVTAEYEATTSRVVVWCRCLAEAQQITNRLQIEFDQACAEARREYEIVDTIFEMIEETIFEMIEETVREELDNNADGTGLLESRAAMIEQLRQWWHEMFSSWQVFVEKEVMPKMADPPHSAQSFVRNNEGVCYSLLEVSRGYVARDGGPRQM